MILNVAINQQSFIYTCYTLHDLDVRPHRASFEKGLHLQRESNLHFPLFAQNVAFPNSATLTETVTLPCFETVDSLLHEGHGDLSAGRFRKRSIVQ